MDFAACRSRRPLGSIGCWRSNILVGFVWLLAIKHPRWVRLVAPRLSARVSFGRFGELNEPAYLNHYRGTWGFRSERSENSV